MEYFIDFSGYMRVKADSADEAERKAWAWINAIDVSGDFSDDVWDIDGIEACYDAAELLEDGAHIISQGNQTIAVYPPNTEG